MIEPHSVMKYQTPIRLDAHFKRKNAGIRAATAMIWAMIMVRNNITYGEM